MLKKLTDTGNEIMENIQNKTAVVIRLSAMGDVALLTGVLAHWHKNYQYDFIVISKADFLPLFRYHPAVKEVYPLEKKDLGYDNFKELTQKLAERYEDYPLFDMHGNLRSRMLAKVWKNSTHRYPKYGFTRRLFLWTKGLLGSKALLAKNVCQRYASILDDESQKIAKNDLRPRIYLTKEELEKGLKKISSMYWPELWPEFWSDLSPEALKEWERKQQIANSRHLPLRKKIIALHPFATHKAKSFSKEYWQELAKSLEEKYSASHEILWLGQDKDFRSVTGKSLVNKTSLRELCAVLSYCDVLITGDSGPMHLANGVDCKTLAIFGPTCEEWGFYPVGENCHILSKQMSCRPCSLHGQGNCLKNYACLNEISHEDILEELAKII